MDTEQLRAELRSEIKAELERATEQRLEEVRQMELACKHANLQSFDRVLKCAAESSADRKAAAHDRAAAAADRAAVEHALAQNEGLISLLRSRVRSAEGRAEPWSES